MARSRRRDDGVVAPLHALARRGSIALRTKVGRHAGSLTGPPNEPGSRELVGVAEKARKPPVRFSFLVIGYWSCPCFPAAGPALSCQGQLDSESSRRGVSGHTPCCLPHPQRLRVEQWLARGRGKRTTKTVLRDMDAWKERGPSPRPLPLPESWKRGGQREVPGCLHGAARSCKRLQDPSGENDHWTARPDGAWTHAEQHRLCVATCSISSACHNAVTQRDMSGRVLGLGGPQWMAFESSTPMPRGC